MRFYWFAPQQSFARFPARSSHFLTALLTLNFAIAYSTWSVYQSEFNTVFAMSILGTHVAEAKSMSGLYLHCLPAAFAYFIVTWFAIKAASEHVSSRVKTIGFVLLAVYFGWYSTANWLKTPRP
jgi:hypothetical protein